MAKLETNIKVSATLMWPFLDRINDMAGKYCVDLCFLSDNAKAALESEGYTIRNKEEKGNFVTCKSTFPIAAYAENGTELVSKDVDPITPNVRVANGSLATVTLGGFSWAAQGKSGQSLTIKRLVITDLIEYVLDGQDETDAL
jgi:hypothetical protein